MLLSIFSIGATEIESCGCKLATEPAAKDGVLFDRTDPATDPATEPRARDGAFFERTNPATDPAAEVNVRMDDRINCSTNALRLL